VHNPNVPPQIVALSGNLGTHDPTVIQQNGVFYIAQTGPGLQSKQSTNLTNWSGTGSLFSSNPSWIAQQVPGATDLWAPDLSFFGGQYHLYYSASTFGSNRSCIGHATRASMASGSWVDQGPVICTQTSNDYNAIDPNVIVDQDGTPWMSFGSFWSGIKLIRLNQSGGRADSTVLSIASRGGGAIEAPVIVRRCGFYYLFVSFDSCCQGANSTYNIRVGRSQSVTGPYVDRNGVAMMNGGGTQIVTGNSTWRGPGHNSVFFVGNTAYNMYHAYQASNGAPILRISEMVWDANGWPISAGP
jgi:arabinan endo-1,5-alpha-L-arabinosidase